MIDRKPDSTLLQNLSGNEFFDGLKPEYLAFLAETAARKQYRSGDALFRQGEHAGHFYLVLDGMISVEVPAIQGPALQLQKLGSGKILGWSWLIAPYRWDFQARILSDAEVIEFNGTEVLAKCEADHSFGYDLFKRFTHLMSERLMAARRTMMDQWNPPGFA